MNQSGTQSSDDPQRQTGADTVGSPDKADIEQNKDIAAFSYLWIMSVVVYFLRRKSPFVRFHARQAIVLFILSMAVFFVPVISKLLELGVLALMVLGFINAAQGQRKDVPIIGPLSRREITIRQAWRQIVNALARLMKSFRSNKRPATTSDPHGQPTPPKQESPAPQSASYSPSEPPPSAPAS